MEYYVFRTLDVGIESKVSQYKIVEKRNGKWHEVLSAGTPKQLGEGYIEKVIMNLLGEDDFVGKIFRGDMIGYAEEQLQYIKLCGDHIFSLSDHQQLEVHSGIQKKVYTLKERYSCEAAILVCF